MVSIIVLKWSTRLFSDDWLFYIHNIVINSIKSQCYISTCFKLNYCNTFSDQLSFVTALDYYRCQYKSLMGFRFKEYMSSWCAVLAFPNVAKYIFSLEIILGFWDRDGNPMYPWQDLITKVSGVSTDKQHVSSLYHVCKLMPIHKLT